MEKKNLITKKYEEGFLSRNEYLEIMKREYPNSKIGQSKTVGVFDGSLLMIKLSLKQLSLFFDKFYIIDLHQWIDHLRSMKIDTLEESYLYNKAELDWLLENEIINEMIFPSDEELQENIKVKSEYNRLLEFYNSKLFRQVTEHKNKESDDYNKKLVRVLHHQSVFRARLQSAFINSMTFDDAYPVIDNVFDLGRYLDGLPKAHVVNVSITKLPTPTPNTPWEQIQDFRQDSDSKEKYNRIKKWIRKIAKENLRTNEINEEIEDLINDYEKYMKIHKIKTNHSILKSTVITTAEMIENIVKLKFGEAAKQVFSFENRKISLLEAEMKAPGREIAYIIKAREEFKK